MKKVFGLLTIALAIASSAFTSLEKKPAFTTFKYSNNSNAPSGANEISLAVYNMCPTPNSQIICGTKWDVTDPAHPVLVETRLQRVD